MKDLGLWDKIPVITRYEDKEKRIQAAKKIFSLNLQKFALEKIIQEAIGAINAEIKIQAEEIYKKEFP